MTNNDQPSPPEDSALNSRRSKRENRAGSNVRTPLSKVTHAFIENGSYLKAFLRRFMHRQQDIEDIAQEAYIRAFKIEQGSSIDHPKALIFTIAKNIALNELRRKSRRVTDYIEESQAAPEETGASTEDEVVALERLELYCTAVDDLPEQCRRVYLMRKVHGMSHKEIATQLNITVRTVERHLAKGVLKCRNQLQAQDIASEAKAGQAGLAVAPLNKGEYQRWKK